MTGKSMFWKLEGDDSVHYYKKLASGALIVCGSFLLLEHLFQFGGYDLEIIGHDFYGLVLITIGFLVSIKWKQLPTLMRAIKARDWTAILDEGERKKYK